MKIDERGNKTYKNVTTTQEKHGDKWVGHRVTDTNAPATPSSSTPPPSRAQQVQENFDESSGWGALTEFVKAVQTKNMNKIKDMAKGKTTDDSYAKAKNGANKCRKVEATFSVQLAIMFEYNPIDNCHYFKSAGVAATVGVEFTAQVRLAACPDFYVYLKIGVEVEAAISMSCYRQAVEGDRITTFVRGSTEEMKAGTNPELVFELDMREANMGARGFHMDLDGAVFMELHQKQDCSDEPVTSGYLSGDGSQKEVLFEEYNKLLYVRLEARGETWPEIMNIKPVLRAESKVVFDGLSITPSLSMEVGAGVGVELIKAEIFLKTSVAITMTMGGYLEATDGYEGFYISSFEWNIALGLHLTFLYANFDLDIIAFGVKGAQNGTGGYFTWDIEAASFDGLVPIWSKTVYTTAGGRTLDGKPPEPYGVNLHRKMEKINFYNPDGKKTDTKDNAGNGEGWEFLEKVSAWRWGGGVFNGEIPLNADLAVAKKDDAYVTFKTNSPEIEIYFDGKIKVITGKGTFSSKESPLKVKVDTSDGNVKIIAEKGTKLDRYCVPSKAVAPVSTAVAPSTDGESLVRVSAPTDITATQQVISPWQEESRAIPATGTEDFQLSGYNTSGDAKKLVRGLATGYSYKLAQAGENIYIVYPLMLDGAPQLVVSRLIMTGDLAGAGTGLVHPFQPTNTTNYLILDGDGLTDLDFSVQGSGSSLTVSWVSCADSDGKSYCVKSRTLDLAQANAGSVRTMGSGTQYRYLTSAEGSTVLWAEAVGSAADDNAMLKAWLIAAYNGLTEAMLNEVSVSDSRYANAVFLWATQSRLNTLFGASSLLKTSGGKTAEVSGHIENLETATVDGTTYVLYTTSQPAYFNDSDDGFVTVDPDHLEEITADTERGTIYRLYLRKLDDSGFGTAKLLQTVFDFDNCTEDNLASAGLKDGLYVGSALTKAQADPYFANLNFVTADVDGTGNQTLALFEMGGNSYLLSEADLKAVTSGTGGATLLPIFRETTGMEVNIGSDGTNMAAVFTVPMANSQSNALYVAWWDVNRKNWGAPTILAMRHLQVYEDSIQYELSADELEKAYLGQSTGNEAYDAYLADLSASARAHAAGAMDKFSFSNLQMAARSLPDGAGENGHQLIVLTEGSLTQLKEFSFDMGTDEQGNPKTFDTVVPDGDTQVGFYALAFGAGEQALGEGNLSFAYYDFSVGSTLTGEVSFTNTGTVAIRADELHPATIQLLAGSEEIATWYLNESIPSGKSIRLTFKSLPLTDTLAVGTEFYLTVQEDQSEFGDYAFSATLEDLLIVKEKPELSFGSFDVEFHSVSGNTAELDFNATVFNNGSGNASEVFIQFSYDTGTTDADGREIYYPIDITGSSLLASDQHVIERGNDPITENYKQASTSSRTPPAGRTWTKTTIAPCPARSMFPSPALRSTAIIPACICARNCTPSPTIRSFTTGCTPRITTNTTRATTVQR